MSFTFECIYYIIMVVLKYDSKILNLNNWMDLKEEEEIIMKIKSSKKMKLKYFKQGPTLGTGTFSWVRHVFFKSKSEKNSFALKTISKWKILELN